MQRSMIRECKRCINTTANPAITIRQNGLCQVCDEYRKKFKPASLKRELAWLRTRVIGIKYDAMVGISGGKDSTATLYTVKQLGFTPLAFTFDTGYYPLHIFSRAKRVARQLGTDHQLIRIQRYARPVDRRSFELTARLYDQPDSPELRTRFLAWYRKGREHYSAKCNHALPFVRSCQLCRRLVIRAYYAEAVKRKVQIVFLGINEWTGLSHNTFSAIRKLQPYRHRPPVYIVHLPFLLQRRVADTRRILQRLGWKVPPHEFLIESNANSCLFARAAEVKATRLLGFHPDTTRLAREVTVGFITKKQAKQALARVHRYPLTVRRVLWRADLAKKI